MSLKKGKAVAEADRRVLEAINKTRDDYNTKLDSLSQKNDAVFACFTDGGGEKTVILTNI